MVMHHGRAPVEMLDQAASFIVKPARYVPRDLRPAQLSFKLYWRVYVFATKQAMRSYSQWRTAAERSGRFLGQVLPMPVLRFDKSGRATACRPKLGEVLLCRQGLSSDVISHESIHVATETLRAVANVMSLEPDALLRLGGEIDDVEERLCYIACRVCGQIVDELHERKLFTSV